jgi:hypothetical protein
MISGFAAFFIFSSRAGGHELQKLAWARTEASLQNQGKLNEPRKRQRPMNRWILSLLLGAVLSAAALWLAFRNVPFGELLSYITTIEIFWLFPSMAAILVGFFCRVVRWRLILGSSHRVGYWSAHHPLMIGFMMNCILPGRIGEVARPLILRKRDSVPFTTGLATVAAERVFDLAILIGMFAAVMTAVDIEPGFTRTFAGYELSGETLVGLARGMVQLSVLLVAGVLFISVGKTRHLALRVVGFLPEKLSGILSRIIENVASGFSLVKDPGRMAACLGLSVGAWLFTAVSYYAMALGCPGIGLSFFELTVVMVVVCFFIALPSVPGFWGLWEAGGVFAMALFGVPSKEAAGFTLVNHAVQMFPIILVGLLSALITGVNILQVSRESRDKSA